MRAAPLGRTPQRPKRLWQSASQGLLVLWIWGLSSLALLVMYGDAKQQAYQWADSLTAVMSRQINTSRMGRPRSSRKSRPLDSITRQEPSRWRT